MSDNKRTGRGMFGKGYYIALVLCAAAIGITGYLYYRNTDAEDVQVSATQADTAMQAIRPTEEADVAVIATKPTQPAESQPVTEPPKADKLKTTAPLAGKTVFGYSMEALSYNQTTRDWRVHNGVDIAAEAGTKVVAAADGVVESIYEDPQLGTTVVVTHVGGYTTEYASLGEKLSVAVGDSVTMGQQIGVVGQSALVESTLGDHVHFRVLHQGKDVDPAGFLKLG